MTRYDKPYEICFTWTDSRQEPKEVVMTSTEFGFLAIAEDVFKQLHPGVEFKVKWVNGPPDIGGSILLAERLLTGLKEAK